MLANGCGTHRIEGLIKKILEPCELKNYEVLVTTTGIVVTIESEKRSNNYGKAGAQKENAYEHISLIEDIVNSFANGELSAEEALVELENIESRSTYPYWITVLAYGMAGCFRTLMFGGQIIDGLASILCGVCMGIFIQALNSKKIRSPSS